MVHTCLLIAIKLFFYTPIKLNMTSLTIVVDGHGSFPFEWDLDTKTLNDVRTWLVENVEIPVENQIVKFMGGILHGDKETLRSLRLVEGAEVHVEDTRNDSLPVTVERLAGGDPIMLTMSRSVDTIASLKRKIEEQEGIALMNLVIRRDNVGVSDAAFLSRFYRGGVVELQLEVHIDLRVNTYTGQTFVTNIASHELVSALQQRVQTRLRIPIYHQEVVFDEIIMEPSSRLNEHTVINGSNIQIRLRLYEMDVFLKTLVGQTILITVTSHDTVFEVKRKVSLKEGIPIDRQRIVFTGIQLHNHERFLSYRIEHESAVHIVLRTGDSYEVAVTTPTGRLRSVEVTPRQVVGYIKRKMLELEGIAISIQKLYFNDQLLENDNATMEDCGIISDSHVDLQIDSDRNTQIFISFRDRSTISFWVNPDLTVLELKELIITRESLPLDQMDLYFTRMKLENDRSLRSYVIESNHMLHVEIAAPPVLQLTIIVGGEEEDNFTLEEPDNITVEGLKRAILTKKRYPVPTQQLFFGGNELDNDQKLKDCGIVSDSRLDLILVSNAPTDSAQTTMHLFVKTLTGKTIRLETELSKTVRSLKEQICEKEGMEISSQCLIMGGKQIDDEETIASVGVQNQSVIHLVLRVQSMDGSKLTIQDGGRQFNVTVDLQGTVGDLKRRIEQNENIPMAGQRLFSENRLLADEDTLAAQNISDGLTLQLIRD